MKIPKLILITCKFLSFIFTKLVVLFIAKLFTTPIKHKIPKRELEFNKKTSQKSILVSSINKNIVIYQLGDETKKVLLVHGWCGRGTQLVKFAEELIMSNYSIISFDAPAHGKSAGNTTIMLEFIESIKEIDKQFGPFEAAIGHSLGGISLLNSIKDGLKLNCIITIGSADIINDIMIDFVAKLELDSKYCELLKYHFEKKYKRKMDSLSAHLSAKLINIPILIIHDENDNEVPVKSAYHIHENLKKGALMITQNLGHRKILGDANVIQKTIQFTTPLNTHLQKPNKNEKSNLALSSTKSSV